MASSWNKCNRIRTSESKIAADLKWTAHISVCRKAGSTQGFLWCNLQNCSQECHHTTYIALVWSTLEYVATVWDQYLKHNINKLECIQRQAAGFITDYRSREPGCIENMLKKLQLPPRSRSPQTAEADHTAQDGWGAWCQRCHQNIS